MARFEKDQPVTIKALSGIAATVLYERPGDAGLPEEERLWKVRIEEQERFCRVTDLQAIPELPPLPYSPEWIDQLNRFTSAGSRWTANKDDLQAWNEFAEAGTKLGFFVPKQKP